jgi:hypothetical protein
MVRCEPTGAPRWAVPIYRSMMPLLKSALIRTSRPRKLLRWERPLGPPADDAEAHHHPGEKGKVQILSRIALPRPSAPTSYGPKGQECSGRIERQMMLSSHGHIADLEMAHDGSPADGAYH